MVCCDGSCQETAIVLFLSDSTDLNNYKYLLDSPASDFLGVYALCYL